MRYTYDVLDARENTIETGLSSEAEAHEYIAVMRDSGQDTSGWHIREQEHATVKGLGRDPDLH